MNDGRCDRNGRFIVGGIRDLSDMKNNKTPNTDSSAIYRINPDLSYQKLLSNIKCTNSICFSLNGDKMYMTDTFGWNQNPKIMEYEYFNDHRLPSNGKIYTNKCRAPDGACIDSDGYLWSADCGTGRVIRYDKNGDIDIIVNVPDKYPTCCLVGEFGYLIYSTLDIRNLYRTEKLMEYLVDYMLLNYL